MMGRYGKVGLLRKPKPIDWEKTHEAMEAVGIRHFQRSWSMNFQEGNSRKLPLARALVQEPLILLLDEPTTYLDSASRSEIMEIIHSVHHQKGLTTLLVSHDSDLVEQYSNKTYLLEGGKSRLDLEQGMSWTQALSFPFMQYALIAVLFAGIAFPTMGVFTISLNLIPLRFAMMHVALLGGAIGLFLKVDPIFSGMLLCALSSLALGPISEKTTLGVGTISGYFMAFTLALAFILFYKANIPVLQAFNILWGSILSLTGLDLIFVMVISLTILSVLFLFYKEIQAILYDREIALAVGIPERMLYFLIIFMLGLTIAVSMRIIGALLVDAFILLPAMGATLISRSLKQTFFLFVALRLDIGDGRSLPVFSLGYSNKFNHYARRIFNHRGLFCNTEEVNHGKIEEDFCWRRKERFHVLGRFDTGLEPLIASLGRGSRSCLDHISRGDRQSSRCKGSSGHRSFRNEASS